MITYPDIEDLLDFQSQEQPIISFYLNTDRARFTLDEQRVTARNLLRDGRNAVENGPWNNGVKGKIFKDFDDIEKYLEDELVLDFPYRGLALFSCSEARLRRIFELPQPVPSNLHLETSPHVRPLTLILDEYHRFGVLLLDTNQAEFYETYIGEINKLEKSFAPSAATISLAPVERPGSADRGKSRREAEEVHKHFRQVADRVLHLFHRRHCEYLVLGGQQGTLTQFENYLHPTLKERLVGRFAAEPGKTRPAKILEEVSAIERRVEIENENRLVRDLVEAAHGGGMAVLGLEQVLTALQMGAVHQLFVQDGWHTPGVICRNCGHFGLDQKKCPACGHDMTPVADMVDEVIETAIKTGCIIEHVHPEAGLAEHGNIGAFLRFKM